MLSFARQRAFAFAVLTATALCASNAQTGSSVRPLAYTRIVLPNGLVALVNEDHGSPLVVVDVWYHIGSKDDKPGHTGMAHLCEHLFNQGSPNLDQTQASFYSSIGGTSPHFANTTEDITHFYIAVPSNQLETVLWVESDRMAAPFARVDAQRLSAVRDVIQQERDQNVDNIPFGSARELVVAGLFPAGHPYHETPLPPMADLYGATVDDLKASCGPYYVPGNAVLSISGDVTAPAARALIEKYFGGIPRRAMPARAAAGPVSLPAEKRVVLEDRRANQPRLQIDWPVVGFSHPDRLALRALASALSINRFGARVSASRRLDDDDRDADRQRVGRAARVAADAARADTLRQLRCGHGRGIAGDSICPR
jgi:zinc protease